jgi:hypothetical protein
MRVIVTASRDWVDWNGMVDTLAAVHAEGLVLVVGRGGRGDRWAEQIAVGHLGWGIDPYPADWKRYGKRAGPIRNAAMVASGGHLCIGFLRPCSQPECPRREFHWSHGATNTLELAEQADIPIIRKEDPRP